MTELPADLSQRSQSLLPEDRWAAAIEQRQSGIRRVALRVNTLRSTREHAAAELAAAGVATRDGAWMPDALVVERGTVAEIQACSGNAAGAWYIQSLASIAVGHALAPKPGQRVLDACAAPGSKASHLAALMQNQGNLIAADASKARIFRLHAVLEQLGAIAQTKVERAERWGRRSPSTFDAILVDVPCSAEGRALAGDDESAADWSLRKCRRLASEQKSILHSAIDACAPGGVIVYSTCTIGPEENEEVLERALRLYAGRVALEPVPVQVPGAMPGLPQWKGSAFPPELAAAVRIAPLAASQHPDGPWLEGFFIARLRKLG
ncbi:MAG: RsmB/NOP family class I SAM-dependent RNA methyltransferase [Phycisphaerae bacterium]|nr:RsmB/NOP family class I SAM-dependent RNA methyltransferase [Phycisphaerae bacterium]